ncbi:MAG: two-component system, response regulator YesN, partial [Clostridiales bacterium]|nr:two-component system, response regulator YesN [Clostridiales bacterium]
MIKVLLVDDEILVRTNIKLMLQDFSDRICICGEASNGQEALSLIPRLQPDVILSDMMMPIMNGVVLCEQVHKNFPDIAFIALSNYDDFEFVRGTLKSGGIDYLLKHTLDAKTLSPILLKLDKKDQNAAKTISYSENSINALREKFVLDLFGRMFYTRDDILYHLNALYIRLDVTQVQPLLMRIDNYAQLLDKQDANKRRIVEFS